MTVEDDKSAILSALADKKAVSQSASTIEASDNRELIGMLGISMSTSRFAKALRALAAAGRVGHRRLGPEGLSSEGATKRIWLINP